jgi:hypothetical protein
MTHRIRRKSRLLTAFASSTAIFTTLCTLTVAHASFYSGGGINTGVTAATGIAGVGIATPSVTINNVINVFASYTGTFAVAVIVIAGMYLILGFGNETSKETAKKIILYAAIGIAVVALGREIVDLFHALPTGTDVVGLGLRDRILGMINLAFKYVGAILLVVIFLAGLIMLTSGGDEARRDTARKMVIYALIGTAILALSKALAIAVVSIFSA